MLFSNPEVAKYINENFEPAWQSLRDVPIITVDFGGGRTIKRTLHGNIATYVCMPDGSVIDVLPGIYSPKAFVERLAELHTFAVTKPGREQLLAYHQVRSRSGGKEVPQGVFVPVKAELSSKFPLLDEDVTHNERSRRAQIHSKLAAMGTMIYPAQIQKWLYKEVLHADLDDPYLGLGDALFASYPFGQSESATQ